MFLKEISDDDTWWKNRQNQMKANIDERRQIYDDLLSHVRPGKLIGSGAEAEVYENAADPHSVIKIGIQANEGSGFLAMCKKVKSQESPSFPYVYDLNIVNYESRDDPERVGYIAIIEKLYELSSLSTDEGWHLVEYAIGRHVSNREKKEIEKNYYTPVNYFISIIEEAMEGGGTDWVASPQFKRFLMDMRKMTIIHGTDISEENVMARRGKSGVVPVFTDVFAGELDTDFFIDNIG